MEPKPFCLHKTEGANNHIEQGDAFLFARHPIGVTDNQFPAMLTDVIHNFPERQGTWHIRSIYQCTVGRRGLIDYKRFFG
jgi:hypothetical protein